MYHSALNTFKQTHELHIGIKKAPNFFIIIILLLCRGNNREILMYI